MTFKLITKDTATTAVAIRIVFSCIGRRNRPPKPIESTGFYRGGDGGARAASSSRIISSDVALQAGGLAGSEIKCMMAGSRMRHAVRDHIDVCSACFLQF
jgi:hypothetical protein